MPAPISISTHHEMWIDRCDSRAGWATTAKPLPMLGPPSHNRPTK